MSSIDPVRPGVRNTGPLVARQTQVLSEPTNAVSAPKPDAAVLLQDKYHPHKEQTAKNGPTGAGKTPMSESGLEQAAKQSGLGGILGKMTPNQQLILADLYIVIKAGDKDKIKQLENQLFMSSPGFNKLDSASQQKVRNYLNMARGGQDPQHQIAAEINMLQLISNGKLNKMDRDGKTTLDYMSKLSISAINGKLSSIPKSKLACDLLNDLANPDKITQSNYSGASLCVPTSVLAQLTLQPADFARIAVGLITAGSASIPGTENKSPDQLGLSAASASSGSKDALGQVMIDAFLSYVKLGPASTFFSQGVSAKDGLWMFNGILGKGHVFHLESGDMKNVVPDLKSMTGNGNTVSVSVWNEPSDGCAHNLIVYAVRNGNVEYWDEATQKAASMSSDEFNKRIVRGDANTGGLKGAKRSVQL